MEAPIPSPPHATISLDDVDGHLLAPDLDGRAEGQQEARLLLGSLPGRR